MSFSRNFILIKHSFPWKFGIEVSESHPVLYLPGSGGCYKQARSIGSVLYRKMNFNKMGKKRSTFNFHFNTFTIDFDEELTGIYGGTLQAQTEFTAKAIQRILDFYKKDVKIFIVGHSMGGILARKDEKSCKCQSLKFIIYTLQLN